MDKLDLTELERLHAEATPGPWEPEHGGGRGAWIKGATGEWAAMSCGDTDESANANAALIAAMRNALPALIAQAREVERLREMHQQAESEATSQEYQKRHAEARIEALDADNKRLAGVASEYDALIRHIDAGGDFYEFMASRSCERLDQAEAKENDNG